MPDGILCFLAKKGDFAMKFANLIKNDIDLNTKAESAKDTIKELITKLIVESLPVLKEVNSYNVTFDLDTMYKNDNAINTLFVMKEQDVLLIRVKVRNNYLITAKTAVDANGDLLGDVDFNFEEFLPNYAVLLYIIDKLKEL